MNRDLNDSDIKNEQEHIDGFTIPKRELTSVEANLDITLERFREFHYAAGEDFIDTIGGFLNEKVFAGWLMHKYPHYTKEIIAASNQNDIYGIKETVEQFDYDEKEDIDMIYKEVAEFANQTIHTKKRINQILVQIKEYYG